MLEYFESNWCLGFLALISLFILIRIIKQSHEEKYGRK